MSTLLECLPFLFSKIVQQNNKNRGLFSDYISIFSAVCIKHSNHKKFVSHKVYLQASQKKQKQVPHKISPKGTAQNDLGVEVVQREKRGYIVFIAIHTLDYNRKVQCKLLCVTIY